MRPKSESSFEDWRMEIESLIAGKIFSDFALSLTIRKSLMHPAKKSSAPRQIISKLENVYDNVIYGQAILQEINTAEQTAEKSVTD